MISTPVTGPRTPIQLAAKRVERLTKEKVLEKIIDFTVVVILRIFLMNNFTQVQQQQLSHSQQTTQQSAWNSSLGTVTVSIQTLNLST